MARSNRSGFLIVAVSVSLAWSLGSSKAAPASEWPMLRGDLQRTGFYEAFPAGKLRLAWRKELWRELTGPRAEVIVGRDLAFMGTYAGRFYAWDATSGQERWIFETGGPIGHSPAYHDETVFVGSMDGRLYAIDVQTGKSKWHYDAGEGIWVAPTVRAGRVFFGDRGGLFHAVDERSGEGIWRLQTGDRILTTASISTNGAEVLFASEDMHLYCIRAGDGGLLWKSRKLAGITVRDYAPVIVGDLAIVTTSPVHDFHSTLDRHQKMLVDRTGFKGKDSRYIPGTAADVRREQEFIVEYLQRNPDEQTFYAFRISDGTEPWIAPVLYTGGLHNPISPPCVNRLTGEVFTHVRSAYTTWDGGVEVRPLTGFGRLDLRTGRVALLDHGYPSRDPSRPPGDPDKPWGSFNYIGDETQTLSCAPGLLLCTHQGNLGRFNFADGTILNLFGKRDSYGGYYGGANFGWENQGGVAKAKAAGQPYGLVNEWHGPARAMISVAHGRVYFPVGSQVLCLEPTR